MKQVDWKCRQKDKNYLYTVNSEIASAKYTLEYCRDTEQRLRQELHKLYEEKRKIESLIRGSNNDIAE